MRTIAEPVRVKTEVAIVDRGQPFRVI